MFPSGNPILDHIDQKMDELHPLARKAIFQGLPQVADPGYGAQPQAPIGGAPAPAAPAAPAPIAGPAQPARAIPGGPAEPPAQQSLIQEHSRLTAPPIPGQEHTKASTGQSGIAQIHNPWARIPLQALDAIGSGIFPRIAQGIPGTEAHHEQLIRQNSQAINQGETVENEQQKRATEAAQIPGIEAEAPLREAQTTEAEARAAALADPKAKTEFEAWLKDPNNAGKSATEFTKERAAAEAAGKPKEPKEGELPLGERIGQLNQGLESRWQVLHKGGKLPPEFTLPANATQKDFDRLDRLMEAQERALGTKTNQDQLEEDRKLNRSIAQQNRTDKQDVATRQAAFKAYTPAMDSAERFNVMAKNYEDATKNHDQQAMLSLLANHLGMTMGLQKGARLTKDIIHEAEQSRPWLQGLKAKFDGNGYLSGVTLTPEQMQQMVNLGRERFSEDTVKAHSEAKYLGANDEGPERTPNKATISHYIHLANGDPKKAKELAAADGWTVK